jgi:hypothetical protein
VTPPPDRWPDLCFLGIAPPRPYSFIQWKGTDVCMDVYCVCGEQFHIDDFFAYYVKCLACDRVFEVGCHMALREVAEPEMEPRVDAEHLAAIREGRA